jgi:hypothetical protein
MYRNEILCLMLREEIVNKKTKFSLYLIRHHMMNIYEGVSVSALSVLKFVTI